MSASPDGKQILFGSDDNTLRLWDIATGSIVRTYTGHGKTAMCGFFTPDGNTVVSCSSAKILTIWDFETATEKWSCNDVLVSR